MALTFLDTSILIAAAIDLGEPSVSARTILKSVVAGHIEPAGTAWHCCLEFYSVATRLPAEVRVGPSDALKLLTSNVFIPLSVYTLPAAGYKEFLADCVRDGIRGGRLYDAHIAEVARRAGATLVVTDNRRDFTGLLKHGVRVLTSPELCRELQLPGGR